MAGFPSGAEAGATSTGDRSLGVLRVPWGMRSRGADGTDALLRLLDETDQRSAARFDQAPAGRAARLPRAMADLRADRRAGAGEIRADRTRLRRAWSHPGSPGLTGLGLVVAMAAARMPGA